MQYNQNSSIVIGEQIDVNNANINLNGETTVSENLVVSKSATVTEKVTAAELGATTAASGSFRSADNKAVTVVEGIITAIQWELEL